ncbi:hypothetical protein D9M72_636820 [compost metagenome]
MQVGQADGLALCPGVVLGDESEHGIAAQMQRHQAVVFDVAPQQSDVGLVAEQPLQDLIGIGGIDLHIDTGVTAAEA